MRVETVKTDKQTPNFHAEKIEAVVMQGGIEVLNVFTYILDDDLVTLIILRDILVRPVGGVK